MPCILVKLHFGQDARTGSLRACEGHNGSLRACEGHARLVLYSVHLIGSLEWCFFLDRLCRYC